jgi:hypothetical protein
MIGEKNTVDFTGNKKQEREKFPTGEQIIEINKNLDSINFPEAYREFVMDALKKESDIFSANVGVCINNASIDMGECSATIRINADDYVTVYAIEIKLEKTKSGKWEIEETNARGIDSVFHDPMEE